VATSFPRFRGYPWAVAESKWVGFSLSPFGGDDSFSSFYWRALLQVTGFPDPLSRIQLRLLSRDHPFLSCCRLWIVRQKIAPRLSQAFLE